jgi:hypothetical protein
LVNELTAQRLLHDRRKVYAVDFPTQSVTSVARMQYNFVVPKSACLLTSELANFLHWHGDWQAQM